MTTKSGLPIIETEWMKNYKERRRERAENPINPELWYEEVAYDLIEWKKGQEGAAAYCEQMIAARENQIKELTVYDGDTVSSLQSSIMDWGAILSKVRKGFEPEQTQN